MAIIPSVKEKGSYYFDPPIAIKKYITFLQDSLQKRNQNSEEQETKKFDAEIRLKEAKASLVELELNELKGKMHRSEDVQALIEDLAANIKSMLSGLPGRLAMDVVTLNTTVVCFLVNRIFKVNINKSIKTFLSIFKVLHL